MIEALERRAREYYDDGTETGNVLDFVCAVVESGGSALELAGKLTEDVLRGGLTKLESGGYDVKADPRTSEWKAGVEDSLSARRGDLGAQWDGC